MGQPVGRRLLTFKGHILCKTCVINVSQQPSLPVNSGRNEKNLSSDLFGSIHFSQNNVAATHQRESVIKQVQHGIVEDLAPQSNKSLYYYIWTATNHGGGGRRRYNSAVTGQQMLCERLPERCSGDRSSSLGLNQIVALQPPGFTLKPSWRRAAPTTCGRAVRLSADSAGTLLSSSIQSASAHVPPKPPHCCWENNVRQMHTENNK